MKQNIKKMLTKNHGNNNFNIIENTDTNTRNNDNNYENITFLKLQNDANYANNLCLFNNSMQIIEPNFNICQPITITDFEHTQKIQNWGQKKSPKNPTKYKFNCNLCNYFTNNKKDFYKHNETKKHNNAITYSTLSCKHCGNTYKHNSSLSRHIKLCQFNFLNDNQNNNSNINILHKKNKLLNKENKLLNKENKLLKENKFLNDPTTISNINSNFNSFTINNNINTTINKTFNLQIYLNEECKNAMNITEFVQNIQLQLKDIDNIGNEGYAKGISNIIVKQLNSIHETQRPIHCSDIKRETLYVKDDDKWQKDTEKYKIGKMITSIENKNLQMLPKWKESHPDYHDYNSKSSDHYSNIIMSSMDSTDENKNKIIRSIAKNVQINK